MDIGGPGGQGAVAAEPGEWREGRVLEWVGQRPLKPLSFQEPGMWHSLEVGSLQIVK